MSYPNPIVAEAVIVPLEGSVSLPPISMGGVPNSGTGIYGDAASVSIAVAGVQVMSATAAGVSMPQAATLTMANDVVIIQGSSAPSDGTTGANVAGPGSLYIRVAGSSSNAYINCNTKASPTWKLITRAA